MNFQIDSIIQSKNAERKRLAALPFGQKLVLLEKLRDRNLAISTSRLRMANIRKLNPLDAADHPLVSTPKP
jgi:hypothetical protein